MDKELEQLEFLGFIGVLKESLKIIISRPKIFTKITLAYILPLTFILLANNVISKLFSNKIIYNSSTLNTQVGSPTSNIDPTSPSSKWVLYWVFEAFYFVFIFTIIFSLLSISAVVYTVACIHTGKEVTFKQVTRAIPKVWKRLVITLISNFCIFLAYVFAILLCILTTKYIVSSKSLDTQIVSVLATAIIILLLTVGVSYISIFWQLANVISVMEDYYGFQAMKKSRELIKGKFGSAIAIMVVIGLCNMPSLLLNQQLQSGDIGIVPKIICIIVILVLNPLVTLYGVVVQSVLYFVCKSYHHENIDKSSLANHLEAFRGDYVPLLTETLEIV